ncbi:hypothetical protein RRF57_009322 [Xylaria bambusicola]|uniref:Uncharacterized protein n=1 Tax=Xylaria bambusicola TaxID=326684 RepID=A0AAN7ZBW4_9PEZI
MVPRNNASRVDAAGRVGGVALCGQRLFGHYLDSKAKRVAGLEILWERLWSRLLVAFLLFFASALFFFCKFLGILASALLLFASTLLLCGTFLGCFKQRAQPGNLIIH